jgi:hypothetical protein
MPRRIFSTRSRLTAGQADTLLKAYADRNSPRQAAERAGVSLNAAYETYARIRWRLILSGYYRDGALSADEPGLSPQLKTALKRRRNLGPDDIYAHAAEVMEWAEDWPAGDVLRHLRKIIAITGPLDVPPDLSPSRKDKLAAYIRYARTKLIYDRARAHGETDETNGPFIERTRASLETAWRDYRRAAKQVERTEYRGRKKRLAPRKSKQF